MKSDTEEEKTRHLVEVLQVWACQFAGNILKNVDRVIKVNLEPDLQELIEDELQLKRKGKSAEKPSAALMLPSTTAADAAPITDEEMRDFLNIDLHLIDKSWYFNKIFNRKR